MDLLFCLFCKKELTGNQRKYCSRTCSGRYRRKKDPEYFKRLYRDWAEKNKEHRKEYMKQYRAPDEYRIMKSKHDKTYRNKHGNCKRKRTPEFKFKVACRAYAWKKIKKEECYLCNSKENLELHHSEGYKEKSLEGIKVICKKCHVEVIHGRGTRIQNCD